MRFAVSLFEDWSSFSNDEMSRLVYSVHERFCSWRGTLQNCSGNSPSIPATQKSFMGIGVQLYTRVQVLWFIQFLSGGPVTWKRECETNSFEGKSSLSFFAAFEDLVLRENNRLFHFGSPTRLCSLFWMSIGNSVLTNNDLHPALPTLGCEIYQLHSPGSQIILKKRRWSALKGNCEKH